MTTNLVIQAGDIETQDLKNLYGIAQAKGADGRGIEKINGDRYFQHQAFRILNANPATIDDVRRYCEDHKLDFGFVADRAKLSDVGLIAMDMDSTLITIECIDEIADFTGRKAEVAAVTEAGAAVTNFFAHSETAPRRDTQDGDQLPCNGWLRTDQRAARGFEHTQPISATTWLPGRQT